MKQSPALRIISAPAGMDGGGVTGFAVLPGEKPPISLDMTEEGYALALAYAGDASWQSIQLLRNDVLRSIFQRMSRQ